MSRPSSSTAPASGRRWPVMRLKSVVLPAPLGPMMAAISPRATARLTPPTASNPPNALRTSRTSSTAATPEAPGGGVQRADDPAREHEQQHDEHRAQDERPVLGVRGDLLVEDEHDEGADGGAIEVVHAPEDGHDQDLGGLRPVGEVGEHAAVEDPEQRPRETREAARNHECDQLVAADVDADELRPFGILTDGGEEPAKRRPDDPAQRPQAQRHQ